MSGAVCHTASSGLPSMTGGVAVRAMRKIFVGAVAVLRNRRGRR